MQAVTVRPKLSKNYTVFLFADLRNFSAYTRRYGDEAAYHLVKRFFALVRTRVHKLGGVDWKTDGDQILITFPTAHQAVAAALSVMDGIANHNKRYPDASLSAGIGVDAGEPVQVAGEYIGSTVNRTARVTGLAKGGQVLVTESVRQLAQNIPGVEFTDCGRYELKGFGSERLYQPLRRPVEAGSPKPMALPRQQRRPVIRNRSRALLAGVACCLGVLWLQPPQAAAPGAAPAAGEGLASQYRALMTPVSDTGANRGLQQLFADARRFTVFITVLEGAETRTGAGFVVDRAGIAVTTAHLVGNASVVKVSLADRRVVPAAVVRVDREADIAVIKLAGGDYDAAPVAGSSRGLETGDEVVVLGYPMAVGNSPQPSLSWGYVSRTSKESPQDGYLQLAAGLNPGDSGGPVVNRHGEVVAMNVGRVESMKGRPIQGIGFALPAERIRRALER